MKQTDLILPFDDLRKYEDTFINGIKNEIMLKIAEGESTVCPCCDSELKPYRIKLSDSMLRDFEWLVGESINLDSSEINPMAAKFVDLRTAPDSVKSRRVLTKLKHFGLIEQEYVFTMSGKRRNNRARWRPTVEGIKFFLNATTVNVEACVYGGETLKLTGQEVSFRDVRVTAGVHHESN